MVDFLEVAERVWVARSDWHHVNVTAVGSERGILLVDTGASLATGREIVDAVRALGAGDVHAVVNTHAHFDHRLGNAAVREAYPGVPVHGHESLAVEAAAHPVASDEALAEDPRRDEALASPEALPDHVFSSVAFLDLGDRYAELVHPGPGHSGCDVVVRLPEPDVVVAGDLVEQAGPPSYGPDCHPLDWPVSLDLVTGLLTPATVVVPGHGDQVDREFVAHQRAEIGVVAETIRDLVQRHVPLGQALEVGEWPFPVDGLRHAVRRGYDHLPHLRRQLPLI
ncbi:MAG: MBL fold metallo-hydrolase [Nocardioides sp.]|uniref:MBL fold metallo-hydrolase n=1 Tax=Nocardioides sp. TaxID=35761 RepID=UPI003F10A97C